MKLPLDVNNKITYQTEFITNQPMKVTPSQHLQYHLKPDCPITVVALIGIRME